jgi:hypothetical protein
LHELTHGIGAQLVRQEADMKIIIATLALASAFAAAPLAKAQDSPAPKVHSMTGCLEKGTAPGSFMLTNVTSGPKQVGIVASSANLAPHVGHKVEITGTAVPAKQAEADPNVPKSPHYMQVTALKMISDTCP